MGDRYGNRDGERSSRPLRQSDIVHRASRDSAGDRAESHSGAYGDRSGASSDSHGSRSDAPSRPSRHRRASYPGEARSASREKGHSSGGRNSNVRENEARHRSRASRTATASRPTAGHSNAASSKRAAAAKRKAGFSEHGAGLKYTDEPKRAAKNANKRGGKLKVALAIVAALVLVGVGAAFAYYENINGNLHSGLDQDLSKYLVKTDLTNEPFYMLLMGTDGSSEREADDSFGGSFRTDSIILARIDPVNKKASLVSIHRDSVVDMGEYGEQKINAAHAFGGASLSVQTVSKMAGVDISHYAEINFDGFRDIIDALGGVEVDVPVEIDDEDAGGHLDAGLQTLNGDQALILCRSRNAYANAADPDSMRAANQRLVLSAIAQKILSCDVATIANSVTAISKYVTTDLSVSDIIGLAQAMSGMDTSTDMYTAMEPVTSKYIDGGWYTYTNKDEWAVMIKRMDEGLPPSETAEVDEQTGTVIATNGSDTGSSDKYASVVVKNGTTKSARTEKAVDLLKDAGFVNTSGAAANTTDYKKTLVVYDSASQEYEAKQIAEALGQGSVMLNDGEWLHDGTFLVVIGSDWED